MNHSIKIPYWGHKHHHFWSQGADFSPENGHIQDWKLAEKSDFCKFFNFLQYFWAHWTCTPVETNQCIKIPYWGHNQHHFWSQGTDFSPENGQIQPLKTGWKFRLMQFFSNFFHIFGLIGPVHLWKQIGASKNLTGGTTSTFFGPLEQIYSPENGYNQ